MKNDAYCMMKSLQKPRKKPLQYHSRSSHSSDCMNKVILMGRLTRAAEFAESTCIRERRCLSPERRK
nr:MAG TPA: Primosomal replication protein n Binding fold, DNA BINDING.0A [Caudoviricetes sp.]